MISQVLSVYFESKVIHLKTNSTEGAWDFSRIILWQDLNTHAYPTVDLYLTRVFVSLSFIYYFASKYVNLFISFGSK